MPAFDTYLTVPYVDQGRDHAGVDCWGLVRLFIGEQRGLWLPDHGAVAPRDLARIAGLVAAAIREGPWRQVTVGADRACDVVLVNSLVDGTLLPVHCGVVTRPGHMLHTKRTFGVAHIPYRDGPGFRVHPSIDRFVAGCYRHESLA
jgi:cell wall-associated NlpC family hydrolase